jgi:acyl-CoA thioester hydrolase
MFSYKGIITADMMDSNQHLHHSKYLYFLEEARWATLCKSPEDRIRLLQETGAGYVILEMKLRFRKELLEGDAFEILTTSKPLSHPKICLTEQRIRTKSQEVLRAEITFGLLDLKKRKLIEPPEKWKKALGF